MKVGLKGNLVIKAGESSALKISSKAKDKGDQFNGDIEDFREPTEIILIQEQDVANNSGN